MTILSQFLRSWRPTLGHLAKVTENTNTRGRILQRRLHSSQHLSSSPSSPSSFSSPSSVDLNEVSHFNALASEWWDPYGSSRLLHLMNPLRIQFIKRCLSIAPAPPPQYPASVANINPPSDRTSIQEPLGMKSHEVEKQLLTYLDVGCGGGILSESLARLENTKFVIGVDPSRECIAVAKGHKDKDPLFKLQKPEKLIYAHSLIEDFTVEKTLGRHHEFDVVTLMEVIEHVPYPSTFLTQCMKHVKPGGWLVLSTIARTWTSWFTTKLVAEDILRIVPRGTHDWEKYINEDELRQWFGKQTGWGGQIEGRTEGAKGMVTMGCVYAPGLGWTEVQGAEKFGNYFFGVRRNLVT